MGDKKSKLMRSRIVEMIAFILVLSAFIIAIFLLIRVVQLENKMLIKKDFAESLISTIVQLNERGGLIPATVLESTGEAYSVTLTVSGEDIGLTENFDLLTAQNMMQAQYDSFSSFVTWFVAIMGTILLAAPIYTHHIVNKETFSKIEKAIEDSETALRNTNDAIEKLVSEQDKQKKRLAEIENTSQQNLEQASSVQANLIEQNVDSKQVDLSADATEEQNQIMQVDPAEKQSLIVLKRDAD